MELPQAFIFVGRSGAGKGTQADLLKAYLAVNHPQHKMLYLQTGDLVRQYIAGNSPLQQRVRKEVNEGKLMPSFFAVQLWSSKLVNEYDGASHLIVDGTPRKLAEAMFFDTVFDFFSNIQPHVIYLDVPMPEAARRLIARGRPDDGEHAVEKRMSWYETDVMPMIQWLRKQSRYEFHHIKGDQPIAAVHHDIIEACKL